MSVNTNMVILGGNIGQTPVLRQTASGRSVLNFSIANDFIRKVGGTLDRKTTWHDITVWDEQAEHNARHLTSGSNVLVTGRVNVRAYTDRVGNKRRQTEIVADKIDWIKLAPRKEQVEFSTDEQMLTTKPEAIRL